MSNEIEDTIKWFRRIYLDGIPILLKSEESAFLAFICMVTAIDALAGYRYQEPKDGVRFAKFVGSYFPVNFNYSTHANNLYLFRCRMLHNFSPAYFSLVHASSQLHLQPSKIGDYYFSDETFFAHMRDAADKYFGELPSNAQLQTDMLTRLHNKGRGGSISVIA